MNVRIVGLGAIGTRFARATLARGHRVTAIDIDPARLGGVAHLVDGSLELAAQPSRDAAYDVTRICVGTTGANGEFDGSNLEFALGALEPMLSVGELVAIESTVPPFTTQGSARAILEHRGRVVGRDFFLVAAPERGDVTLTQPDAAIPKLVGGVTPACTERGVEVFGQLLDIVVPVSAAVAEAAKMLENAFRYLNVAFVNEVCEALAAAGLEPRDVVAAAATKPFGFMPFWPGAGVGGDCVPLAARIYRDFSTAGEAGASLIDAAFASDALAPVRILRMARRACGGPVERVLMIGLTYKSFARSTAWSAGARLAKYLVERGCTVDVVESNLERLDGALGTLVTAATLNAPYDVAIVTAWSDAVATILERKPARAILDLAGSPHV